MATQPELTALGHHIDANPGFHIFLNEKRFSVSAYDTNSPLSGAMEIKLTKDIKIVLENIRNLARRQGYSEADCLAGEAHVLRTLFWTLKLPSFHGTGRADDAGRDILKWWTLSDRELPAKCTVKYCAAEFGAVERNAKAIGRAIALLTESPNLAKDHMELMIRLEEILKPVNAPETDGIGRGPETE